jgi:methyl-galactoside transport system substrate-binding protein
MLLSLAACGNDNSVSNKVETQTQTEKLNVGIFYYTYNDTFIKSVRTALDEALNDEGIKYQDYDSNTNQITQKEQIDTSISQGTNLLIVNIVNAGSAEASKEIIAKAKAADIPVIFLERALAGDGEDEEILKSYDTCAFVGTEAAEAGHKQGEMIGNYLLENWDAVDLNHDGHISYALFKEQEENADADYRTELAVEDANTALTDAGKPELDYFDTTGSDYYELDLDDKWSDTAAYSYMSDNLAKYNEASGNMIELVICDNDRMAEGVISALNDQGYNLGNDTSTTIPVFGVEGTEEAEELIATGKMTGTVKQDVNGIASCLAHLVQNVGDGKEIMDGTEDYKVDSLTTNKIYLSYTVYMGEQK